jgi:guanine nucleotide-binding protein subunit alpha
VWRLILSETHFKIGELTYKLFDVGGQRSERRKWLNIFDSVTALVFLIAISECEPSSTLVPDER